MSGAVSALTVVLALLAGCSSKPDPVLSPEQAGARRAWILVCAQYRGSCDCEAACDRLRCWEPSGCYFHGDWLPASECRRFGVAVKP